MLHPRLLLLFFCIAPAQLWSQMYFPPTSGNTWDTLAPSTLGWCPDQIDSLLQFVEDRDSKSLIILKDGKIVLEAYFGDYTADSIWYWASCSKSLVAYLVGIAQEQGDLSLDDSVSQYLGTGWTSCPPAEEGMMTIRHQISMTTGLDDNVTNTSCTEDTCLYCLTAPDTRWAYHNGPYRLAQDVVVAASGAFSLNQYTNQNLGNAIGMGGFWFNRIRFSNARDMARFGLLALNNGVWNGNTILGDSTYLHHMVHTANPFNQAYGYLWWLNGTSSYMVPGLQFQFNGPYAPSAPADMFAALGKDDQKIYVVPSTGMVVVRQGLDASSSPLAVSAFDEELWQMINQLNCSLTDVEDPKEHVALFPNPTRGRLHISGLREKTQIELWSVSNGALVRTEVLEAGEQAMDLQDLAAGLYVVRVGQGEDQSLHKVLVQ